jgi:hypothetical protein
MGCPVTRTDTIKQPDEIIKPVYATACQGSTYRLCDGSPADTSGTYKCIQLNPNPSGCDTTLVTYLTVYPKHVVRDTIYDCAVNIAQDTVLNLRNRFGCDSTVYKTILPGKKRTELPIKYVCEPGSTTTQTNTYRTWKYGCDSVVIQRFASARSYHRHEYIWVCDSSQVRAKSDTFPTYIYRCDSIITTHYQLAKKDYRILADVIVDRKKEVQIKIDSFKNQYGCDSIQVQKFKLASRDTTIDNNCNPAVTQKDSIIEGRFVNERDILLRMHYVFNVCECLKKAKIYNRLIPNDIDTFNNLLFMENYEFYKHLPLELVIVDKRGMQVYKSPFKNNWSGKDDHENPLPEGIYNYILWFRDDKQLQCVRRGVLDIKYIED